MNLARSRVLRSPIAIESLPPAEQHAIVASTFEVRIARRRASGGQYGDLVEMGLEVELELSKLSSCVAQTDNRSDLGKILSHAVDGTGDSD